VILLGGTNAWHPRPAETALQAAEGAMVNTL
jgi:hypothetical protein